MESAAEEQYQALLRAMREEFPKFRVIKKSDSPMHRAIHHFLVVVTLGQMREYLQGYQTTIGDRVYVTDDWDDSSPENRLITMRHELVHVRQFHRYTLVGMALLYVLWPFPLGLAYGRARLEWEAYTETIRATAEIRGDEAARSPALRERIVSQFTGPSYGWMWPFRKTVERWYDRVIESL